MTEEEIMQQLGKSLVERKKCFDKMSCYEARLKDAARCLALLLDEDKNPLHEDNQRLVHLDSDPRLDAKGYIEEKRRAEELTAFLKKHNAL